MTKNATPIRALGRKTRTLGQAAQQGVVIIESLTALLIFALGILGLLGVMTVSVSAQSDAQYRGDAAALTNQIAQQIWLNVDRTDDTTLLNTLQAMEHNPTGDPATCTFTGGDSDETLVTDWRDRVLAGPQSLPLVEDTVAERTTRQQIAVFAGTDPGEFNRVMITVCWQGPADTALRRHTMVALVN